MNYSGLKDAVRAVIKENGNEEITGDILQQTLIAIINALGFGYQFMGVATPDTAFGTPDSRQFYIATAPGTYGSTIVTLDGSKVAILLFADSWDAITLDVPTVAGLSEYLKISDLATSVGTGENTAMTQKATSEAIVAAINTALLKSDVVQSLGDDATKVLSQAAITTILLGYAKIDGVYPDLVAGLAQNLVGRGSVLAELNYRPTGGNADIGTGTARIKKLLGKSIIWNQLIENGDFSDGVTGWAAYRSTVELANGFVTITPTVTDNTAGYATPENANIKWISGHKYLILAIVKGNVGVNLSFSAYYGGFQTATTFAPNGNWERMAKILTITNTEAAFSKLRVSLVQSVDASLRPYYLRSIMVKDLTDEFGVGKEPATIEEFEELYRLNYYGFNPGTIKNVTATGLKTIGFNQWDEQWELGGYDVNTGAPTNVTDKIRSKNDNPISVFPSTNYYFKTPSGTTGIVFFYDDNLNYISRTYSISNTVFTTPSNARYLKFYMNEPYGTTYNNDICINISWSGYRNGEYEPYWENTLPIPITTMTGKLNGAGESVTIFPDGMKGIGNIYDESDGINATKKLKKYTFTGNEIWGSTGSQVEGYFTTAQKMETLGMTGAKPNANIISNKFPYYSIYATPPEASIFIGGSGNEYLYIRVPQSIATDNASLNSWLSAQYQAGTPLEAVYELETPEEYVLDNPLELIYKEDDFGTEEKLPADTALSVTAPLLIDVQYPMNAVDTLRRLPVNYISKESFDAFCAELATKLGAAIGKTITITSAFNTEQDKYNFTITIV